MAAIVLPSTRMMLSTFVLVVWLVCPMLLGWVVLARLTSLPCITTFMLVSVALSLLPLRPCALITLLAPTVMSKLLLLAFVALASCTTAKPKFRKEVYHFKAGPAYFKDARHP